MLVLAGAFLVSLVLLIPGILFVKLKHGASLSQCIGLLAGYLVLWLIGGVALTRLRKHDALWGTAWGVCFFVLLFLSWRL
jgi:hypothetical protein